MHLEKTKDKSQKQALKCYEGLYYVKTVLLTFYFLAAESLFRSWIKHSLRLHFCLFAQRIFLLLGKALTHTTIYEVKKTRLQGQITFLEGSKLFQWSVNISHGNVPYFWKYTKNISICYLLTSLTSMSVYTSSPPGSREEGTCFLVAPVILISSWKGLVMIFL